MDLIQDYNSDSEETSTLTDNPESNLEENKVRSVYLVTYSQADKQRFPTRLLFARALVQSFVHCGAEISHWCCSEEEHKAGGTHYHVAIKLNKIHRWNAAKRLLSERYGIIVNFSGLHTMERLHYMESGILIKDGCSTFLY